LKKLITFLVVFILMSPLYIGIHRLVYSTEYKRIEVLKTEIIKKKPDSTQSSEDQKNKAELADLEKKVNIFRIVN
jgi:hypothetical protein